MLEKSRRKDQAPINRSIKISEPREKFLRKVSFFEKIRYFEKFTQFFDKKETEGL